jgi:fatty acid synthase subunit alpha
MSATDTVAHQLEAHGMRTFSPKEMAFNMLGLMHLLLFSITQVGPKWADLAGGIDRLSDLAELTTKIRNDLNLQSELRQAISKDTSLDFTAANRADAERVLQTVSVTPRANFKFEFPKLDAADSFGDLAKLRRLVDLEKVIVVTGYAKVGSWDSSRTRWEWKLKVNFFTRGASRWRG